MQLSTFLTVTVLQPFGTLQLAARVFFNAFYSSIVACEPDNGFFPPLPGYTRTHTHAFATASMRGENRRGRKHSRIRLIIVQSSETWQGSIYSRSSEYFEFASLLRTPFPEEELPVDARKAKASTSSSPSSSSIVPSVTNPLPARNL